MAVKAPVYKAPPVILSDWAGFYVGFNAGGGWADNRFDISTGENLKPTGGVFGGQAGYNWQFGSLVVGVEGDFDGADISKTDPFGLNQKTEWLASARGRLGYSFLPNVLVYGTAGAGWGHTVLSAGGNSVGVDQSGWVAGAGLEYKLWGPLIARGEYLHYDFAKRDVLGVDNLKETVDVVRGGLSYKF
jgi:outer membrane immunogenic protein